MLQNPHGLKLFTSPLKLLFSLFTWKDMGIGALCIPETNINWGIKDSHSKWFGLTSKVWQHSSYITSHTQEGFKGVHQPGGTLTFLANNWTSRIIDKGSDPFGLGRWSYVTLRGSGEKRITLVTAYRVCVQSIQSCGDTTSTAQQFRELSKIWRQQEALDADPIPRRQFILDLQAWLEHKIATSHHIILGIDANEDISKVAGQYCPLTYSTTQPITNKTHNGSLATLLRTCDTPESCPGHTACNILKRLH
jgi:hypothetical protein